MQTDIIIADYHNARHQAAIRQLMDHYARDPMGGGEALPDAILDNIATGLAGIDGAFTVLALQQDKAVGLINALPGFSTFKCKPLINIHDVVVVAGLRGQGIAGRMMARVEDVGRQRGCCKLTLEVLQGNSAAQASYRNSGFDGYELDPQMGSALFWQKVLS